MAKKSYQPFISEFKNDSDQLIGWNVVGLPKDMFKFQTRVYKDLPIAQGDKTFTFAQYHFVNLSQKPSEKLKLFGLLANKIKQNNQMENCVNGFIGKNTKLPTITIPNDIVETPYKTILDIITIGMQKTKEFYKKNPPLPNQEIKVFETIIDKKSDNDFVIKNLTNKYFDGKFEFNGQEYVLIHLPFETEKRFMVPSSKFNDNQNGSFNVIIDQKNYMTLPSKNLKEISAWDFKQEFDQNITIPNAQAAAAARRHR